MPKPEHASLSELDANLVHAYGTAFISRTNQYPLQLPDGSYISIKKPLNIEQITQHLKGQITLGAYALDAESQAHWLCLDADTPAQWNGLLQLTEVLQNQGVVPYLEQSRRGGHLWLFTQKLPGKMLRQFGKALLSQKGADAVRRMPL